jgi:hypothetical protein
MNRFFTKINDDAFKVSPGWQREKANIRKYPQPRST